MGFPDEGVDGCRLVWRKGFWVADLHIHSQFSRATSRDMNPEVLGQTASQKGIMVVGTGDFTHPVYLDYLEKELEEAEPGLYVRHGEPDGTRFMLTAEISNIFTQSGRNRRIHTVIFAPHFEAAREILVRLGSIGNISSDGRPIFGFPVKELVRMVMDVSPDCLAVPAHIWTPWFSVLGAKSGFDSLEDCFEEETGHIHAVETGLSSDPPMNWRLSALDRFTLISNSDAHSPSRLGREANIFSCEMSYPAILDAIKGTAGGFEGTIEFFPEEGKYHYDGHRACGVCFRPDQTVEHQGICPVCGRMLTVGVLHRVEELADRPEGFVPGKAKPCVHLVPLEEIIAESFGIKTITGKVRKEYRRMLAEGGAEIDILLRQSEEQLSDYVAETIREGIIKMRNGQVHISPGHDGAYGKICLFPGARQTAPVNRVGAHQMNLF